MLAYHHAVRTPRLEAGLSHGLHAGRVPSCEHRPSGRERVGVDGSPSWTYHPNRPPEHPDRTGPVPRCDAKRWPGSVFRCVAGSHRRPGDDPNDTAALVSRGGIADRPARTVKLGQRFLDGRTFVRGSSGLILSLSLGPSYLDTTRTPRPAEGCPTDRGARVNRKISLSNDGDPPATTPRVTQRRQEFLRLVRTGDVTWDHSRSLAKVSRTAGLDVPGEVLGSDINWSMQVAGSRKGRLNSVGIVGPPLLGPPSSIVSAVRHLDEESHREGYHSPTPSTRQEPMGDYSLIICSSAADFKLNFYL